MAGAAMLNATNAWRAQPPAAATARIAPHYPFQYAWMPSMRGEALDIDSTPWFGMRSAAVAGPGDYTRKDLSLGSATGGVLPIVINARGLAINFAADGSKSASNPAFGSTLITGYNWTIIVALTFRTLTGALISQRTGGAGWLFEISSNNYQWYDDANGGNSFGVGPTVGVPTVVVITRTRNQTLTLYATGIPTTAIDLTNAPQTATPLQVGAHSGTSGALDATVSLVAMGLGTANGAMARSLVVNPWQIFEPAPAPQIFLGPTAAAAFNAAWNAGANSLIHSGGAQVN